MTESSPSMLYGNPKTNMVGSPGEFLVNIDDDGVEEDMFFC